MGESIFQRTRRQLRLSEGRNEVLRGRVEALKKELDQVKKITEVLFDIQEVLLAQKAGKAGGPRIEALRKKYGTSPDLSVCK